MPFLEAVFLDREGVLTSELARGVYLTAPEQAVLAPGVCEALRPLVAAGVPLFIVSNQSCVSHKLLTLEEMYGLHARILVQLSAGGVDIVESVFCPHADADGCACRKPLPGLFVGLCEKRGINPENSATIGDMSRDMVAGKAAGIGTRILLGSDPCVDATRVVPTLAQACKIISELPYDQS